jgi:hypothetical protein
MARRETCWFKPTPIMSYISVDGSWICVKRDLRRSANEHWIT